MAAEVLGRFFPRRFSNGEFARSELGRFERKGLLLRIPRWVFGNRIEKGGLPYQVDHRVHLRVRGDRGDEILKPEQGVRCAGVVGDWRSRRQRRKSIESAQRIPAFEVTFRIEITS